MASFNDEFKCMKIFMSRISPKLFLHADYEPSGNILYTLRVANLMPGYIYKTVAQLIIPAPVFMTLMEKMNMIIDALGNGTSINHNIGAGIIISRYDCQYVQFCRCYWSEEKKSLVETKDVILLQYHELVQIRDDMNEYFEKLPRLTRFHPCAKTHFSNTEFMSCPNCNMFKI